MLKFHSRMIYALRIIRAIAVLLMVGIAIAAVVTVAVLAVGLLLNAVLGG